MALQKALVPVLLRGLNQKRDPKVGMAGEFSLLENLRFNRISQDAVELAKDYGFTALSSSISGGGSLSSGSLLGTRSAEMFQVSGGILYSYSSALSAWVTNTTKMSAGAASVYIDASVATTPSFPSPNIAALTDVALLGSTLFFAAYDNNSANGTTTVRAVDANTNRELFTDAQTGGTNAIRLVAGASSVLLFLEDFSTTTIKVYRYTSSGLQSSATLAADGDGATVAIDAWMDATSGNFFCAYCSTTGVRVVKLSEALAVATSSLLRVTKSHRVSWLKHDGADGNGYLAVDTLAAGVWGSVNIVTMATSTATTTATNTCMSAFPASGTANEFSLSNMCGYRSGGVNTVFAHISTGVVPLYMDRIVYGTGGGTAATTFLRSVGLASSLFYVGTDLYAVLSYQGSTPTTSAQGCYFLRRMDAGLSGETYRVTGQFMAGYAPAGARLASVVGLSSTSFVFPALKIDTVGGTTRYSVIRTNFDFSQVSQCKPLEKEREAYLPGGCVDVYDGLTVLPAGFTVFPEACTVAGSATVGAMTTAKTYQYIAVYARADAHGRVLRSAPSIAASVTLGGGKTSATVTVNYHQIGNASNGYIEIYRTKGDGTLFYRLDTGQYANSTADDSLTFTDSVSDTTLGTGELLYSTVANGVLGNDALPPARFAATWGNYLVLACTENPREFWVSKPYHDGFGVAFSGELRGWVDDAITGMATLDDKCIIFCATRIYVLTGDGPNDLGQGMPSASLVSSGNGTQNQRSITVTPDGVMFQHTKGGIYLLDRSFTVAPIGQPAADYDSLTITGAATRRERSEAWFVTSSGRALVYDWEFKQWRTRTNTSAVDAVVWNGAFIYLKSNGTVEQETAGTWSDDGAAIVSTVTLSWLSPFGVMGYGRVYQIELLTEYRAAHTLEVALAYDFKAATTVETLSVVTPGGIAWGSYTTWGHETAWGGSGQEGGYRYLLKPKVQKCTSIQITLLDVLATASEGFRLTGLALSVGLKSGPGRVQAESVLT